MKINITFTDETGTWTEEEIEQMNKKLQKDFNQEEVKEAIAKTFDMGE